VKSTCSVYVKSKSTDHSQYSSSVEALNLIVESKSLPAEVHDLNIELHLLVEVKEKLPIISVDFYFLASVLSCYSIYYDAICYDL